MTDEDRAFAAEVAETAKRMAAEAKRRMMPTLGYLLTMVAMEAVGRLK